MYTVSIAVKPYVKRFLVIECGEPADLSVFPDLKDYFRKFLRKPNNRYRNKYRESICGYSETIDIAISEDDFYRYGWELTQTDTVSFGKLVEYKAKCLSRTIIGVSFALGFEIKSGINRFQERFGFTEEDWQYDTIKKDFYRNGLHERIDFDTEILKKIEKIILDNLYKAGTE